MRKIGSKKSTRVSRAQAQTRDVFSFKWAQQATYESAAVKKNTLQWLRKRYCNNDPSLLDTWLSGGRKVILDAGCGSGFTALLLFGARLKHHEYIGVDISDAVILAQERFKQAGLPGTFLKANIMDILLPDRSVDMIYSEGVLHHTDSTERSLRFLARKLKAGGRFLFYVYAKKAPVREFTDDYVRRALAPMSDRQAWEALRSLTKLGIALGKRKAKIVIPEDIPFLGISRGVVDLQRFFYWNICKMYYHPRLSLEEMNHVNFDWFRPLHCHRHTPDEVKAYCRKAGLAIEIFNVEESGITVVARK